MLSYHIPDKLRIRKSKKHLKIDENIENWRNNSKIKLKIVISIISGRILTEKWNFRNFRWGVEDDSRVSIVNDVNNCSSSTKSSRRSSSSISCDGYITKREPYLFHVKIYRIISPPICGECSNKNRKFKFGPRDSDHSVHEWLTEEKRETLLTILRSLNRWIINLDAFCSERGSGSPSHFCSVT